MTHTRTQTDVGDRYTHATTVGMSNYNHISKVSKIITSEAPAEVELP